MALTTSLNSPSTDDGDTTLVEESARVRRVYWITLPQLLGIAACVAVMFAAAVTEIAVHGGGPLMTAPEIEVILAEDLHDGWDRPQPVTEIDLAFPARGGELTPAWAAIPDQFRKEWSRGNCWTRFVNDWFSTGWPTDRVVYPRPDVDPDAATEHLRVVLGSYALKHEHKMAGAGWLMSRWFGAIRPASAVEQER